MHEILNICPNFERRTTDIRELNIPLFIFYHINKKGEECFEKSTYRYIEDTIYLRNNYLNLLCFRPKIFRKGGEFERNYRERHQNKGNVLF